MSRQLTSDEVETFLNRQPGVANRVLEFNLLVSTLGWDQVVTSPGFLEVDFTIPGMIPPDGINVTDSQFGHVLIAPDAMGNLHFIAGTDLVAGHPVSGATGLPSLPQITSTLLTGLFVLGIGFVVLETRPWRH